MEPIIYFAVCIILIFVFVCICRYLDRKRRIEIYMRMLTYLNTVKATGFCGMYERIVGETIDTDDNVYSELWKESRKLPNCNTRTNPYAVFWFPPDDIASRRVVLLNLINKLSKQWI